MEFNLENECLESPMMDVVEHVQKPIKQAMRKTITSEALFSGSRELLIQHANDSYSLRITNQGKLILTK